MSFETNPRFLRDLLAEGHAGRLQLSLIHISEPTRPY